MTTNIRAKKSLGQNFLKDPHYLNKIADAARVGAQDQVLEIGPGLGHLTRTLSERAGKVLALELDDRLIPRLRKEFPESSNTEIVQADALEYDYEALRGKWKVVANLPYYISTPLIQRLLAHHGKFSLLTLMLQKEVAERITARTGGKEYGYLTVLVRLYCESAIEFLVPAGAFTPKPEVDSAVVSIIVREHPSISQDDRHFFLTVVKAAFSQRRKTLRNALKQLAIPAPALDSVLDRTGIDLGRRAETLTVEEFGRLAAYLHTVQ